MEYICLFLFLLHVISTSSLLIPNSDVTSQSKRLTLRSIDPLTRRSAVERNFIRFGRSVVQNEYPSRHPNSAAILSGRKINLNKREALHFSPENADRDLVVDDVVADQPRQSNQNGNLLCLVPDDAADDHMLCMGPRQNASNLIYVLVDQGEEVLANQTDGYLRYARSSVESDRIRKSKSGNFMRLGRSKMNRGMFSRYDRGRDNFMRLGRSGDDGGLAYDKRKYNFMRLGRSGDDDGLAYDKRRHDSFMRLGRMPAEPKKPPKKYDDSFMRLGRDAAEPGDEHVRSSRGRDNFMRLGRTAGDDVYDRYARRHDSFMRLGRTSAGFDRSERRSDNFMRLGRTSAGFDRSERRSDNFMRLGRTSAGFDRLERRSDNFMRLGRASNNVPEWCSWETGNVKRINPQRYGVFEIHPASRKELKCTNIGKRTEQPDNSMRRQRDVEMNEPVEWTDEEKRSKSDNFMRLGRSVQRTSRSTDDEYDMDDSKPEQLASTKSADAFPEFAKRDSSESSSNITDRRWNVESVDNGASEANANEEFVRESRRRSLLLRFGRSDDSRSADLDGGKCEGYQCAESGRAAASSRSSPADSAAKTNVL